MFLSNLKIATAVASIAAAVGLSAGGLTREAQADEPGNKQESIKATSTWAGFAKVQTAATEGKKDKPLLRVPMPERTMITVALSAKGQRLAVSRQDGTTVQLWNVITGKEHTLRGHAFSVTALAFSPDGTMLASATGSWLPEGHREFSVEIYAAEGDSVWRSLQLGRLQNKRSYGPALSLNG